MAQKSIIVLENSPVERDIMTRIYRECGYETTLATDDLALVIDQYIAIHGEAILSADVHLTRAYQGKCYTGIEVLNVLALYDTPLHALVLTTDLAQIEDARAAGAGAFLEKGTPPTPWRLRDMFVQDLAQILRWISGDAKTRPVTGERVYGWDITVDKTGFVKMLRRTATGY